MSALAAKLGAVALFATIEAAIAAAHAGLFGGLVLILAAALLVAVAAAAHPSGGATDSEEQP